MRDCITLPQRPARHSMWRRNAALQQRAAAATTVDGTRKPH
jgi:hypothetical protein